MSYRKLEIFQIANQLFFQVHPLSLELPKYELYEIGSQLRRSAGSVGTNIVEGYGRREYKQDFIKFLTYSHSSCDETIHHLETLHQLYPSFEVNIVPIIEEYRHLSLKISNFKSYVRKSWRTESEE